MRNNKVLIIALLLLPIASAGLDIFGSDAEMVVVSLNSTPQNKIDTYLLNVSSLACDQDTEAIVYNGSHTKCVNIGNGSSNNIWTENAGEVYLTNLSGAVSIGESTPEYTFEITGVNPGNLGFMGISSSGAGGDNGDVLTIDEVYNFELNERDDPSNFSFSNTLFYIDGLTDKVGIGTASPGQKLSIEFSSVTGSVRTRIRNAEGYYDLGTDAEDLIFWDGAGTERFRQELGGLTTIGGAATGNNIRTLRTERSGARGEIYLRDRTTGYSSGSIYTDGTYIASDGGVFSVSGQNITGSGAYPALYIDHSTVTPITSFYQGVVGIGTLTPITEFQVIGDINVSGTVYYGALQANSPHYLAPDHETGYSNICVYDAQGYWNMIYWNGGRMQVSQNNSICSQKENKLQTERTEIDTRQPIIYDKDELAILSG